MVGSGSQPTGASNYDMWSRRHYLVATVGIAALSGCTGDGGGDGEDTTEPEEADGEEEAEELPAGVSEEEFETGPVPDRYMSATSLGNEQRDSDDLRSKSEVSFVEFEGARKSTHTNRGRVVRTAPTTSRTRTATPGAPVRGSKGTSRSKPGASSGNTSARNCNRTGGRRARKSSRVVVGNVDRVAHGSTFTRRYLYRGVGKKGLRRPEASYASGARRIPTGWTRSDRLGRILEEASCTT
ncbi:MAG: hypothetical protein ACI9YT_000772 [Halobacteriales archaeon]|jgi:hypothetical protein